MSKVRDIRFALEYAALRTLAAIFRRLTVDQASALSAAICGAVGPWTKLHRRALDNLAAAFPDVDEAERRRIAHAMWRNTGRVIAETLLLDRLLEDPTRIELIDSAYFEKSIRIPGPQIGITPHLGNWELVAWAAELCGGKPAGVYRPFRNPHIDRYVHAHRRHLYPAGFLLKGNSEGTRSLGAATRNAIDFLRKGGLLGLVADQVADSAPFTVPFFGHEATFTPAPALFARRLGARIWIVRCLRVENSSRFRVEYRELEVSRTDMVEADIKAATAAMAAQFEEWIRQSPEQWMWWQRRSIGK